MTSQSQQKRVISVMQHIKGTIKWPSTDMIWDEMRCEGYLKSCLPRRSCHKVPLQQPQLAEQDPVHEGHRRQLLQGELRLELEFLLLDEKSHHRPVLLMTWCRRDYENYGEKSGNGSVAAVTSCLHPNSSRMIQWGGSAHGVQSRGVTKWAGYKEALFLRATGERLSGFMLQSYL